MTLQVHIVFVLLLISEFIAVSKCEPTYEIFNPTSAIAQHAINIFNNEKAYFPAANMLEFVSKRIRFIFGEEIKISVKQNLS